MIITNKDKKCNPSTKNIEKFFTLSNDFPNENKGISIRLKNIVEQNLFKREITSI